jgi:lauroyl/myristoyl acyltransferase
MIEVRKPTLQLPYDLARWALETTLREGLPPEEPEVLRFIAGVSWRLEAQLTPARAAVMLDEVRRTFRVSVRTAESAVREAYDLSMQSRLERLLLGRLPAEKVAEWVRVEGELPPRALVVVPHAGNVSLLVAALAWRYPGLAVLSARGVPSRTGRDSWVNRRRAAARRSDQERLPIVWEEDARALRASLAEPRVVVCAFDDRVWSSYVRLPFFEREALLSDEPWQLGRELDVPIIPASIQREYDKTHVVRLGGRISPDLAAYLDEVAEPFLASTPGHYAMWLAECRMRAALDDHPLFVDYAPDARWMRWPDEALDGPPDPA